MATVLENTQETKGFYKLSWVQRIGFGAGDLAQNLIYQTICMYLLFFYTDVYVLGGDAAKSAGLAGTMFLVVPSGGRSLGPLGRYLCRQT